MTEKVVFSLWKGAGIARCHLSDNKICSPVVLYGSKNKYRLPHSSSFCHREGSRRQYSRSTINNKIIKSWNKDVSPIYGITDHCTEEFKAMENIFEGMLSVNYFNITSLLHLKDRLR